MPVVAMSKTLYELQCKLETMENWAVTVNDALIKPAGRTDVSRVFANEFSNQIESAAILFMGQSSWNIYHTRFCRSLPVVWSAMMSWASWA